MHLQTIIQVTEVPELSGITIDPNSVSIGAAVTYSEVLEKLYDHYPSFCEMLLRLGSRQIRNLGTIGGNLVNASPIGDSPPSLVALGARVVISSQSGDQEMPLDDFFLDYRKTALQPDEILKTIIVPRLTENLYFRTYKLSKRFDQDISSVCGAYCLRLDGDQISDIKICYGGMAATPKRAHGTEDFLRHKPWHKDTVKSAMLELSKDYAPMSDFRGSADYRSLASQNLLLRFYLECTGKLVPEEFLIMATKLRGGVGSAIVHDSAIKHVSGEAIYLDDIPNPAGLLHGQIVMSTKAHARIISIDAEEALALDGVKAIYTAKDIIGHNDAAPIFSDEPVLAEDLVEYVGMPMAVIIAENFKLASKAASMVKVHYEELEPILTIKEALEKNL